MGWFTGIYTTGHISFFELNRGEVDVILSKSGVGNDYCFPGKHRLLRTGEKCPKKILEGIYLGYKDRQAVAVLGCDPGWDQNIDF